MPYQNSVRFPWTHKLTVQAKEAMTENIMDCTAGGITNGKDVVLFHLCPDRAENEVFTDIEKTLENMIKNSDGKLQGLLVGSKIYFRKSRKLFDNLEKFMKKYNISCSKFRNKGTSVTNIMYNAKDDEWLLSSNHIDEALKKGISDPKKVCKMNFRSSEVSEADTLSL